MTSTIETSTEPTALDTAYGMAERILAVLNACADHGITPAAVSVSTHTVGIQISNWRRADAALNDVNTLGAEWCLAPADTGFGNYTRSGDTILHGVPLSVTVFTGRAA